MLNNNILVKIIMSAVDSNGRTLVEHEIKERVRKLRLLVLEDDLLKDFRTYDEYLLRFLYFKDFDVNLAYNVMKKYTKVMVKHPKWYPSLSCLDKMVEQKVKVKGFIPGRDRCGRRIYLVESGIGDISKTSCIEEACSDEVWFESVMDEPETQANGISVIIDINQVSWKVLQWFTPSSVKVSAEKAEIYPCKVLLYHIVNTSTLVSAVVKLVWPFISEEAKKSVIFHFDNWPSLHEYISPEVLPPKYGGTGPDVDYDQLYTQLLEQRSEINAKIAIDQKNLQKF